ncbi:MAG: glycosyltransferase [Actinomycetes bacterium]
METAATPRVGTARVLAVVVAHDGAEWLPRTLAALDAQTHAALEVVAVDNGSSDDTRRVLTEHLGTDRVLVAERDLGFGAAVSMALDAAVAGDAEHLLLVHDDVALAADAVEALVGHLETSSRTAIAGCKLVDWDDPTRLQEVGMAVDLTGRADSGLEEDERDQGQRDAIRPVLYVSTSGMLVRRAVFEELGRFDRRYHLFRDDLDLCWRAWLAGHDVDVVPDAVGHHVASASTYGRLGQTAFLGPRYFAERNTLATLLKNYGPVRLPLVVVLYFLTGIAKVLGFVATRRLGDAWQTVRAWLWNLLHLRETRRLRAAVQSTRVRADGELAPLFARTGTRARAYAEAIGDWITGGEVEFDTAEAPEEVVEPETVTERVVALVRARPYQVSALALLVVGVVVAVPLLRSGALRGGELAPWPADAAEFWRAYLSTWNDAGGAGTAGASSPAQALLGIVGVLGFGSAWIAPRLLLLGAVPLAWVLALRAGRLATDRRGPRLAAATVYVLSPPAIAALRSGRIGAMVVLVALPALASAFAGAGRPDAPPASAWRNTAAGAIVGAVAVAFEPIVLLVLAAVTVVGVAALSTSEHRVRGSRRRATLRLLVLFGGSLLLLLPWLGQLFGGAINRAGQDLVVVPDPFWRWLLLSPGLPGFPGITVGVGLLAAGLLGLAFGANRRPLAVAGLWGLLLAGVFAAWGFGRAGAGAWTWPGVPLLLTALAAAALLAIAFSSASSQLAGFDFGWRQLASLVTALVVAGGVLVSVIGVAVAPWDAFAIGEDPLPAFLSDPDDAVAGRTLVLAEVDGTVEWELVGPAGPTMVSYGQAPSRALTARVETIIEEMVAGTDPGAGGRLGLLDVRHVVVPEAGRSDALESALRGQLALEPRPVADGRVYELTTWVPRAVLVPTDAVDVAARRGELPAGVSAVPLDRVGDDRFEGAAPTGGSVLLAEAEADGWRVRADGAVVPGVLADGLLRFDLPGPAEQVVLEHVDRTHRVLVAIQALLLLLVVSLMLRPPGFATRGAARDARADGGADQADDVAEEVDS